MGYIDAHCGIFKGVGMANTPTISRQTLKCLVQQFQGFSTTHISDAMGRTGCMRELTPICPGARIQGLAYPVHCPPNDNLMVHYAVKFAEPEDVLVIATGGYTGSALWGELLTLSAKQRGLAGLVTDGYVRDRAAIKDMGFSVFARGVIPQGTFKLSAGYVNRPVSCAGIVVSPGDAIIGDDDGVVVVPSQSVEAVVNSTRAVWQREQEIRQRIAAGEVMYDFLELDKMLAAS